MITEERLVDQRFRAWVSGSNDKAGRISDQSFMGANKRAYVDDDQPNCSGARRTMRSWDCRGVKRRIPVPYYKDVAGEPQKEMEERAG